MLLKLRLIRAAKWPAIWLVSNAFKHPLPHWFFFFYMVFLYLKVSISVKHWVTWFYRPGDAGNTSKVHSSLGPDVTVLFHSSFFCVCRETKYKLLTLEVFVSFIKGQGFSSLRDWLHVSMVVVSIAGWGSLGFFSGIQGLLASPGFHL